MLMTISAVLGRAVSALALPIVFASAGQAAECDPYGIRVTTTPIPPQSASSLRRHDGITSKPITDVGTLVIGDSLVQLWPHNQLLEAFGPGSVLNFGVGSDRTQVTLWRLTHSTSTGPPPARVVIFLGTNNLSAGDVPCAVAAGIAALVDSVRKKWPNASMIILSVPPRGTDLRSRESERLALNAELRKIANSQENTLLFDDWEDFACARTVPCDNYLNDMLHFSEAGYHSLSKIVRDKLEIISNGHIK